MVNLIWVALFLIGIIFAFINGTMEEVNKAIFSGAEEAIAVCIGLLSVLVFWLGLMRIAQKAGLLDVLARGFKPFARKLFPEVPPNHPAMGYILSNMMANMFGLGNAATPMGIKAMEELKKLNDMKDHASRSMITLLALNTSSLTLIPTSVIAIRMKYGSVSPTEIVGTTIAATACSTIGALMIDRFFHRRNKGGI
ncbi:nucleoside recognition domain-containing protein [Alkalihalobacillus macyae]|uniref:nucleoside recognition domain-containing protein n=1 Tax=Guptibacillus hwajinpoensis TaxID=208199 RepID=UPI00273C4E1A|nr:nucleoside recognition domain-containing protein [Alkalihalobacillus macyae]MDP4552674.1 nucleoside recognition domain-containing protein [Alkalihalobacillus macyae]